VAMMNGSWIRKAAQAGAAFAGILFIMTFQQASAQAPAANVRPTPPPAVLDAARLAFEALPEADRKAVQDGLIWTGHYSGVADGAFGRQTFEAIAAFQQGAQKPATGILSSADRKALQDQAQKAKTQAGFVTVEDPGTGVQIGVPKKILPRQSANPSGGGRWQNADGTITLDTRIAPPDATLQALFERNVAIQTPGRTVTYKVLRPDFFVIAGETPAGKFYTRYSGGTAGIRGFSIGYDKALAPQFDRIVVAIAGSFTPFPTAAPVAVAQNPAPTPQPSPLQAKPQAPRLIGTGLVVGSRQVLTTSPVSACKEVRVFGLKPQQILGKDTSGKGMMLLEFAEDLKAKPLAFTQASMVEGAPVLVAAFAEENGSAWLTIIAGAATGVSALAAPLQLGASGAPVLDESGALLGVVGSVSPNQRRIAGVMTSATYEVVPAAEMAKAFPALVQAGKEAAAQKLRAADIVASVKGALAPVACAP
jgi:peptidoglycan hydrolase-like protein with peptidoglycan-binding domain